MSINSNSGFARSLVTKVSLLAVAISASSAGHAALPSAGVFKGLSYTNYNGYDAVSEERHCGFGAAVTFDGTATASGVVTSHDNAPYDLDGNGSYDGVVPGNAISCSRRVINGAGYTHLLFSYDVDGSPFEDVVSSIAVTEAGAGLYEMLDSDGRRGIAAVTPSEQLMMQASFDVTDTSLGMRFGVRVKADDTIAAADLEGQSFSGVTSVANFIDFGNLGMPFSEVQGVSKLEVSFLEDGVCTVGSPDRSIAIQSTHTDSDNDLSNGNDGLVDFSAKLAWFVDEAAVVAPQNCTYTVASDGLIELRAETDPTGNPGVLSRLGEFYLDSTGEYLAASFSGNAFLPNLLPVGQSEQLPSGTEQGFVYGFNLLFAEEARTGAQDELNDAVAGVFLTQAFNAEYEVSGEDLFGAFTGVMTLTDLGDVENTGWNQCEYEDRVRETWRESGGVPANGVVWSSLGIELTNNSEMADSCHFQVSASGDLTVALGWDESGDGVVDYVDELSGYVSPSGEALTLQFGFTEKPTPLFDGETVVPGVAQVDIASAGAMVGVKYTGDLLADADGDGQNNYAEYLQFNDYRSPLDTLTLLLGDEEDFGSFDNQPLPLPYAGFVLSPFWDDINPEEGGAVVYKALGTAPNRKLVVEWQGVMPYWSEVCEGACPEEALTFQVVFSEGSDDILFFYSDVDANGRVDEDQGGSVMDNGGSATIGVQLGLGAAVQFSYNNQSVSDGSALLWDASTGSFTFDPAPGFSAEDTTDATDLDLGDDDYGVIALPFDVVINGQVIGDIAVSSNGFITAVPPLAADTDGDGLLDSVDLDDDNDGMLDADELVAGFDPLDPSDAGVDVDGDGWTLGEELAQETSDDDAASNPGRRFVISSVEGELNYFGSSHSEELEATRFTIAISSDSVASDVAPEQSLYVERHMGIYSEDGVSVDTREEVSTYCMDSPANCAALLQDESSQLFTAYDLIEDGDITTLAMNAPSHQVMTLFATNSIDLREGSGDVELEIGVNSPLLLEYADIDGTSWTITDQFKEFNSDGADNYLERLGAVSFDIDFVGDQICTANLNQLHLVSQGVTDTDDWSVFANRNNIEAELEFDIALESCTYQIKEPKRVAVTMTFDDGGIKEYLFEYKAGGDLMVAAYRQNQPAEGSVSDMAVGMAIAVKNAQSIFGNADVTGDFWVLDQRSSFRSIEVVPGFSIGFELDSVGRTLMSLSGSPADAEGYSTCQAEYVYSLFGRGLYGQAGVNASHQFIEDAGSFTYDGDNGTSCRYKVGPGGAIEVETTNAEAEVFRSFGYVNDSGEMALAALEPLDLIVGNPLLVQDAAQRLVIAMPNGNDYLTTPIVDKRRFLDLPGVKTAPVKNDFDGDGDSDVLMVNSATQDYRSFLMSGGIAIPVKSKLWGGDWNVQHFGDFNGDSITDILMLQEGTGDSRTFLLEGGQVSSVVKTQLWGGAWEVLATEDFDGDGIADFLMYNAITQDYRTFIVEAGVSTPVKTQLWGGEWRAAGFGDFNGDSVADILMTNAVSGDSRVFLIENGFVASVRNPKIWSGAWTLRGVSDFNGDGVSDIYMQHSGTQEYRVFLMGDGVASSVTKPQLWVGDWQVVAVGDFGGDAETDILMQNSVTRGFRTFIVSDGVVTSIVKTKLWKGGWSVVDIGDYNADKVDDILMFDSANNEYRTFLISSGVVVGVAQSKLWSGQWVLQK